MIKTTTSDNETEFAKHKQAAKALEVLWYPYCSQQRDAMKIKMDSSVNLQAEKQI